MVDMKTDLGNEADGMPGKAITQLKKSLTNVNPNVNNITNKFPVIFPILQAYKASFTELTSLDILRKEVENIESVVCFDVTHSMYKLMIISFIFSTLVFLFMWCSCCQLRQIPKKPSTSTKVETYRPSRKSAQDPKKYSYVNENDLYVNTDNPEVYNIY